MKLAIHGAAGRMGQRVTALAAKDSKFKIVAALESADHPLLGKDAGLIAGVGDIGVPLGVVGESNADVVIDFSVPDAAVAVIAHCVGASRPLVVATTGLEPEQQAYLKKAAQKIPIVWSPSMSTAVNIARAGGAVGRVGVPQEATIPNAQPSFYRNVTIAGGPAPVRAYIEELLPDVLEGRIEPGRVFDRVTTIDGVPEGYRAMNDREAIKVMVEF